MNNSNEMRPWLILFAASIAAAFLLLAGATYALAATDMSAAQITRAHTACERAVARWERISAVPRKLLHAISLAESGKWSQKDRRVRAWPWTVTSGGPGTYFETKAQALAEVRRLQASGIKNIDVGCMQINLHFHGHHFDSIEAAMDPDLNAGYAARFLTQLRGETDNWAAAAGFYHSRTPKRTAAYRSKVEKFWAQLTNQSDRTVQTASLDPLPETEPKVFRIAPIDEARTRALNNRFKKLKTAARQLRADLDPSERRKRQIQAWREARSDGKSLQYLLAMRQAEAAKRQQERLEQLAKDRQTRFAENRRRQLDEWRLKRATN